MKYSKNILGWMGLLVFILSSCEPRIDFDITQWGDHAYISNVLVFNINEEEHQLQDYYENGNLTTGIQRKFLKTSCTVDKDIASAEITIPSGTDMTQIGIVIRHEAVRIIPVGNAPKPGYISDFSIGPFVYKVVSADGTERDWTITIKYK